MRNILNPDIINKINNDFSKEHINEITALFEDIFLNISIVGGSQLVRSLLYLSNGNINLLKEYYLPMMKADPRDVIMEAEENSGSQGHYFAFPFDEIEKGIDEESLKRLNEYNEDYNDGLSF
jgi:hypothetical protein